MKVYSSGGFAVAEDELRAASETLVAALPMSEREKAMEELAKAKKNGFAYCLAVFEENAFDSLWVKADPTDGHKDWGRGDTYKRFIYRDGALIKDPTFPPPLPLKAWMAHGLRCEVRDNRIGYNCGYVEIPENHPWYRKEYSACLRPDGECHEDWHYSCSLSSLVDVHGGVTFSGEGWEGGWWIGFDCAHLGDRPSPEYEAKMERRGCPSLGGEHYWTVDDVARETERMARQVADAAQPVMSPSTERKEKM